MTELDKVMASVGWILKGEFKECIDRGIINMLSVHDNMTINQLQEMICEGVKAKHGAPQDLEVEDMTFEVGKLEYYEKMMGFYMMDSDFETLGVMRSVCGCNDCLLTIIVTCNQIDLVQWLTARGLASTDFSRLPLRLSQRESNSNTLATRSRTFSGVKAWEGWQEGMDSLLGELDDRYCCFEKPVMPTDADGPPPADEAEVRSQVTSIFCKLSNRIANKLLLNLMWAGGGSGRGLADGDIVLVDNLKPQNTLNLSDRVYGNGGVKGAWQFLMEPYGSVFDLYGSRKEKHIKKMEGSIQQCYGDMIFDETSIGFLSNFNETLFFRRSLDVNDKSLEISPLIQVDKDKPVLAFVFALQMAYKSQVDGVKAKLLRGLVPVTPPTGYRLQFPPDQSHMQLRTYTSVTRSAGFIVRQVHATTRVPVDDADVLTKLASFTFNDLIITGRWVSKGHYGNLVQGENMATPTVVKLYSLKHAFADGVFTKELHAYMRLSKLQDVVPELLRFGRLWHTDDLFLELVKINGYPLSKLQRGEVQRASSSIKIAVKKIHKEAKLVHNDISPNNFLVSPFGQVTVIDFGRAYVGKRADFSKEMVEVESMLRMLLSSD